MDGERGGERERALTYPPTGKCRTYCSRECQAADWPRHKDECARMCAEPKGSYAYLEQKMISKTSQGKLNQACGIAAAILQKARLQDIVRDPSVTTCVLMAVLVMTRGFCDIAGEYGYEWRLSLLKTGIDFVCMAMYKFEPFRDARAAAACTNRTEKDRSMMATSALHLAKFLLRAAICYHKQDHQMDDDVPKRVLALIAIPQIFNFI